MIDTHRIIDCAGAIDVLSSNGKLTLKGELESVKAKTSNGSVEIEGSLNPGDHEIRTSNGSIRASLTGNPVTVTASTSHGSITANGKKMKKGKTFTLGAPSEESATSVGDTAQVSLTTSNGSIKVSHKTTTESPSDAEANTT